MVEYAINLVYHGSTGSIQADTGHHDTHRALRASHITCNHVLLAHCLHLLVGVHLVSLVVTYTQNSLITIGNAIHMYLAEQSELAIET